MAALHTLPRSNKSSLNPIPAGVGVNLPPPPVVLLIFKLFCKDIQSNYGINKI